MLIQRRPALITTVPPRRRRRVVVTSLAAAGLLVAGGAVGASALVLGPHGSASADPSSADSVHAAAVAPIAVSTTGFPKGGPGIFTDTCKRVTTAANDPILMPGMAGKSMQHDFFGNTATTASSTTTQLVGGTSSCSTSADASAYWTPVLFQNGKALAPRSALIYWRAPKTTSRSVKTIPAGLTIIAGNEGATTPQGTKIVGWRCSGETSTKASASPHDCATGMLRLVITFPNCWDGKTLDGAKQTNVVYPARPNSACPASHPVQIPQIVFHANYPTSSAAGLALSIGPDATGPVTTEHADFMNGWNERTLTADVAACTAARVRCGPVHGATAVPKGGRTAAERTAGHGMDGRRHRPQSAGMNS